jgi:hypothetical protein
MDSGLSIGCGDAVTEYKLLSKRRTDAYQKHCQIDFYSKTAVKKAMKPLSGLCLCCMTLPFICIYSESMEFFLQIGGQSGLENSALPSLGRTRRSRRKVSRSERAGRIKKSYLPAAVRGFARV